MSDYRVIFEIDAEGKSPRDAAEYVYAKHFGRDPENVTPDDACCFTVIDDEAGEAWNVDLAEAEPQPLPAAKPEPINAELLAAAKALLRECGRKTPEAVLEQMEDALARAEAQGQPEPIRLEVWDGVVGEPENLPPGVRMVIRETDTNGMDNPDGKDESGHDYVDREYVGE